LLKAAMQFQPIFAVVVAELQQEHAPPHHLLTVLLLDAMWPEVQNLKLMYCAAKRFVAE
jgi:hypothetical protein